MTEIGKLEKVSIKTVWETEDKHFTPWLAKEENLKLLADALGLYFDIESINTEFTVGPFRADIVLNSETEKDLIVIENQFGKTNHDHLGKLLTYSSVLGAKTIIWISEDFTDEHRQALDWLNENSNVDLAFFGVEIETLRIGNSQPAPNFKVIVQPNEMVKEIRGAQELSETKKLYLKFWHRFFDKLSNRENQVFSSLPAPAACYWYTLRIGYSHIEINPIISVMKKSIAVKLYLYSKVADRVLETLEPEKENIQKEIGENLHWHWNPNPEKKDKVIYIEKDGDIQNEALWDELIDWLIEYSEKFANAFKPRLEKINFNP